MQQGITTEKAKEIIRVIKDSKLKVQSSIQGDVVRVSGKDRDTLQQAIALLRGKDFGIDMQFTNFRTTNRLMPRRIESFFVAGPAGRLESVLEEPEHGEAAEAALVCHPNPQGGGTMHNKVVYRLARGLRKAGCVVLRFNYRGVNLSEGTFGHGVGETDDARVVLAELRRRIRICRWPWRDFPLAQGLPFVSRWTTRWWRE